MAARKRTRAQARSREVPVTIRTGDVDVDDRFRDYILSRVSTRLVKFGNAIHRVSVRVEDLNGPKKAPGMRCAVKVVVTRHESVMVGVVDVDPRTAFDRAIDSAERALRKSLDKVRTVRRNAREEV